MESQESIANWKEVFFYFRESCHEWADQNQTAIFRCFLLCELILTIMTSTMVDITSWIQGAVGLICTLVSCPFQLLYTVPYFSPKAQLSSIITYLVLKLVSLVVNVVGFTYLFLLIEDTCVESGCSSLQNLNNYNPLTSLQWSTAFLFFECLIFQFSVSYFFRIMEIGPSDKLGLWEKLFVNQLKVSPTVGEN